MDPDEFNRRAIVLTFCSVVVILFGTMMYGLFDQKVDNASVFKLVEHTFDLILVALTGFLGGRASKKDDKP